MKRKFLAALLFCIVSGSSLAQYRFEHYTVDDGLSQNTVNNIFQDSEGFIWLTTQDGFNRFDGNEFVHYKTIRNDKKSVRDNFKWRAIEDESGFLWVCNREGVSRINKYTKDIRNFDFKDYLRTSIAVLPLDGKIYVVTPSELFRLEYISNSYSYEKIMDLDLAYDAIVYKGRSIYIFESSRIIRFQKGDVQITKHENVVFNSEYLSKGVVEWKNEELLFCTERGPYTFNIKTGVVLSLGLKDLSAPCYTAEIDENKNLWFSTSEGLFVVNSDFSLIRRVQHTGLENSVKDAKITCIYKSVNGEMWIGYSNKGFSIYKPKKDRFKYLDVEHGLSDNTIWGLAQFEDEIWVGNARGVSILEMKEGKHLTSGLFLMDAIKNIRQIEDKDIQKSIATSFYEDFQGRKFIGTYDNGCFVLDSNGKVIKHIEELIKAPYSNNVTSIVEYDSMIWMTTFGGVFVYNQDLVLSKQFSQYDKQNIPSGYIFKSYLSKNNELYLGSNLGFFKYDAISNRIEHYEYDENSKEHSPGYYFVNDFAEDDNNLWLATYGGGFDKFHRETKKYTNYNTSRGLANDVCSALLFDDDGNLWIGTNNGISRFNIETERIENFTTHDGLHFNEMSINVALKDKSGNLIFGTPEGLIAFNQEEVTVKKKPTMPLLTRLSINYTNYDYDFIHEKKLVLQPDDKVITFNFSSPDFSELESIKYVYRILGVSEKWAISDSKIGQVSYSNLPHGSQIFQVKTVDKYGQESDVTTLNLEVVPPIWLNTWFIVVSIILFILIISFITRFYFRLKMNRKLRQMEVQQRIQKERERISSDLHDHVGAQLTSIISGLQITDEIESISKNEEIRDLVDSLKEDAQNTMINLRDSIWSMNNEAITINSFVEHIDRFMESYLKYSKDLNFEIKTDINNEIVLGPVKALNITRTVEEAVQNIVKHAYASNVILTIKAKKDKLNLLIEDDGIGFDLTCVNGQHYGLENMKRRIKEIEGEITFNSKKDSGTSIHITVN